MLTFFCTKRNSRIFAAIQKIFFSAKKAITCPLLQNCRFCNRASYKIATTSQIENRSERGRMVPSGFFLYGGFCFWSGMDSVAKRYSIHHARTSANRLEIRCSLKKIFICMLLSAFCCEFVPESPVQPVLIPRYRFFFGFLFCFKKDSFHRDSTSCLSGILLRCHPAGGLCDGMRLFGLRIAVPLLGLPEE